MTSDFIMQHLMKFAVRTPSDILVPNYFVGRWEMDLMKVSKDGIVTEYEVKITRADFKKDFEKVASHWGLTKEGRYGETHKTNKHEMIRNGLRCNRFYFVCPEGLIMGEDLPKGYGLIWVTEWGVCDTKRNSSLFHKQPIEPDRLKHIAINLSCKLRDAKWKLSRLKSKKTA